MFKLFSSPTKLICQSDNNVVVLNKVTKEQTTYTTPSQNSLNSTYSFNKEREVRRTMFINSLKKRF